MATIQTLTSPEVEARVVQAPVPVALDFYQATCPPCRALEPRLQGVTERYARRLEVYRVDIDRDLEVAERFGVQSLPTVVVFRGGKEVDRLDGLITNDDLEAAFDRASRI